MELKEILDLLLKIVWVALPVIIGFAVQQYKKHEGDMALLNKVAIKAQSLVKWAEMEYPEVPYIHLVEIVIQTLLKELEEDGIVLNNPQHVEPIVVAAFRDREMQFAAMGMNYAPKMVDSVEVVPNPDI